MTRKDTLRMAAFLLLCLVLVLALWQVFSRKTVCDYTLKVNGFFNEPPETMDVICYGTSRMYCTIDPLVLHHETGLNAYVLATQQQPLPATYYFMKESFRTQSPKLVILEATMAFRDPDFLGSGALRDCLDPLPWSKNKIEIIRSLVEPAERKNYYFNFLQYHQRWKELGARDFDFRFYDDRDPFRGYIYLTPERGADCRQQRYDDVEAVPIAAENLDMIRRMRALAEENGAAFMLLVSSYEMVTEDLGAIKSLHAFCEDEGIPLLDLNEHFDELGVEPAKDYFDTGHFNARGSAKATRWIARRIEERFDLQPQTHALDAEIEANYDEYILPLFA